MTGNESTLAFSNVKVKRKGRQKYMFVCLCRFNLVGRWLKARNKKRERKLFVMHL